MGTYRTHRAACPQGPTYSTYGVRVPASGVGYVPRTVAPQVLAEWDEKMDDEDEEDEEEEVPRYREI